MINIAIACDGKKKPGTSLTGIERYLYYALRQLCRDETMRFTLVCFGGNINYLRKIFHDLPVQFQQVGFGLIRPGILCKTFYQHVFAPFDAVVFPSQFSVLVAGAELRKKSILVIHDLCPLTESCCTVRGSLYPLFLQRSIASVAQVVCVHPYWVSRLRARFPVRDRGITSIGNPVVWEYLERNYGASQSLDLPWEIREKYFLHIGSGDPRKGTTRVLNDLRSLPDDYQVVIVGRAQDVPVETRGKVVFVEDVSDALLFRLYRSAAAFLQLSSCEGGITYPVIEAFYCGCPVIAFDLPTFREIRMFLNILPDGEQALRELFRRPEEHIDPLAREVAVAACRDLTVGWEKGFRKILRAVVAKDL